MLSSQNTGEGILGQLMAQMKLTGLSTKPTIQQNEIHIVITQAELAEMATKGIDATYKNSIKVELHEGQMQLTVKLF
jgi:hypothetical protein